MRRIQEKLLIVFLFLDSFFLEEMPLRIYLVIDDLTTNATICTR